MSNPDTWTDEDLIAELLAIDNADEVSVSRWEYEFIENVCHRRDKRMTRQRELTPGQRKSAADIIRKYEGQY